MYSASRSTSCQLSTLINSQYSTNGVVFSQKSKTNVTLRRQLQGYSNGKTTAANKYLHSLWSP